MSEKVHTEKGEQKHNGIEDSQTKPAESRGSQPTTSEAEAMVPASELEAVKKDLLYLRAEFDNYRKQALKERAALIRYGGENLVRDLLNVLDNFERALSAANSAANYEAFREGMDLTARQFRDALKNHGICEVEAEGNTFDPTYHEALSTVPSPDHPPGTVIQVYRRAYTFHDKLIRPALVVVAADNS